MGSMAPMPSRDSSPPPQEEGLGAFEQSAQAQAPTSPEPDPKDILKNKLSMFRSLDEQVEAISRQSAQPSKYATQVKNLLKAWMMDEVRNTKERTPSENPRMMGP